MKKIILFIVFIIVSSTIMATNYYVTTGGNDGNNGSSGSPWKSVYKALSVATAGDVVNVGTGTFTETNFLMVPAGVSIIGAGSASTTINVNKYYNLENNVVYCNGSQPGWAPAVNQFCIQIASGSNQTIKGFAMSGQSRTCHGAIYVDYGSNVVFDDLNIQNFKFTGIWIYTSDNSEVKNCYLKNNCYGNAFNDAGNIMFHANTNLKIHDNYIEETGVMGGKGGYGIKTYSKLWVNTCFWVTWDANWNAWADGMKIYNNTIIVPSLGTWLAGTNSVPAITIEFNGLSAKNIEIYNNHLTNHISLIGIRGTGYDFTSFNVHNNTFDLGTDYRYAMEADAQGIEFHHNYINGGYYPIAQWGNNTTVNNLRVHHNVFYAPIGGQAFMHVDHSNMKDLKFYNNTVVDINGVSKLFNSPTGSYSNADIRNNLFIATAARGNYFTSGIASGTVAYNGFQNNTPYGTNTVRGDMQLTNSGNKPVPYFILQSSGPAVNAGVTIGGYTDGSVGTPDMGAFENGVTPWTSGVNSGSVAVTGVFVMPTTVSIVVGATTTLTATVAPANASNNNVTWSSNATAIATVSAAGVVTGIATGSATITVTTQDGNKIASSIATVTGAGAGVNVPAKIEAENWTAMSGVQTETTTDAGGGQNVGYINQNDWMDYAINVPATGVYTVDVRLASVNNGRQLQLKAGSTNLATVNVPQTGNWQTWQTVSVSVNLNAGAQTIRVLASNGDGWNINWFEIKVAPSIAVTGVEVTPTTAGVVVGATTSLIATVAPSDATNKNVIWTSGNTAVATVSTTGVVTGVTTGAASITATTQDGNKTSSCTVTVTAGGGSAVVYEAENGTYGGGGQTQNASNASNGQVIGNLNAVGSYSQVASVNGGSGGAASLVIRYSNGFSTASTMGLYVNNTFIQNVSFPVTGGWNTFANATVSINLSSGTGNTIKLQIGSGNAAADIDKYTVTSGSSSDTQPPTTPTALAAGSITTTTFTLSWAAASDNVGVTGYDVYKGGVFFGNTATTSISVTGLSASTTYGMTVKAKDAAGNVSVESTVLSVKSASINTIQAESYNAMSGITNKTTVIGGCDNSDYAVYNNIDFTPGYTNLVVRQACDPAFAGQKAEFRLDGVGGTLIGTCTIVSSGNWTTFVDNVVTLSAVTGIHNLYVVFVSTHQGVGDFDYFRLTNSSSLNTRSYGTNNNTPINVTKAKLYNVYPNPVYNRNFTITIPESKQNTLISIFDLNGKIVYKKNYVNETQLNVHIGSYLSSGLYIIKVANGSTVVTQKLIID